MNRLAGWLIASILVTLAPAAGQTPAVASVSATDRLLEMGIRRNLASAPLLMQLVYDQQLEALSQALAAGEPIDTNDHRGATALHWAAALDRKEIGCLLLRHGANPNARDIFGMTPLHFYYLGPRFHTMPYQDDDRGAARPPPDWLLTAGAHPELTDDAGLTPRQAVEELQARKARFRYEFDMLDRPFHLPAWQARLLHFIPLIGYLILVAFAKAWERYFTRRLSGDRQLSVSPPPDRRS